MAYTINYASGVRQDHRGRKYRLATYPNGKVIEVPYTEATTTPWGKTLPLPPERELRRPVKKDTGPQRERRAVVEWRDRGTTRFVQGRSEDDHTFLDHGPQAVIQAFVDTDLRPLVRSPDCGKTWIIVAQGDADWFVQYHEEAA